VAETLRQLWAEASGIQRLVLNNDLGSQGAGDEAQIPFSSGATRDLPIAFIASQRRKASRLTLSVQTLYRFGRG